MKDKDYQPLKGFWNMVSEKDKEILELKGEVKRLEKIIDEWACPVVMCPMRAGWEAGDENN